MEQSWLMKRSNPSTVALDMIGMGKIIESNYDALG